MRYLIGIAMAACVTACRAQQATNSTAEDNTLLGLAEAVTHTPYLAKVQHVNVVKESAIDPKTQEEYDRHVYSADVLTTYRGESAAQISYIVLAEKDEDALLDTTPVIVALCLDEFGQLYWPGTGSQFPVNSQTEMWLDKHKKTTLQQQGENSWCND